MGKSASDIIKEIVEEILGEMTSTGAAAGYMTPNAFRGKKSKNSAAARSMPGGKVVGAEDESDDTTVGEERLPIMKRTIGENRYRNFKKNESMKSHSKVCYGIREAKKMLREVEFLMNIVERLKSEDGVDNSQLWKRTQSDLAEITQRSKDIANRVRRIGKK
jgi:hypothetical protein